MSTSLRLFAMGLAAFLLCATLAWHFPLMLWDHLDLVPIYTGWRSGELMQTGFLHIHGGHLHTAAYVLLLATTWLSDGQTWLDCFVSWLLLIVYAGILLTLAGKTLPLKERSERVAVALIVLLALYPGHLANLQWGWQVAVFLCLVGSVVAIRFALVERMTWWTNLIVLAATGLALLSFATGLALVPIVLVAIAARTELRVTDRILFMLPWLLVCGVAVYFMRGTAHVLSHFSAESVIQALTKLRVGTIGEYILNYLGAGVVRFVPAAAPWLAAVALVSGVAAAIRLRHLRLAWPWIGFLAFGVLSALLTALARYGEGESQAFASRYVSFSVLFWIGWSGLFCLTGRDRARPRIAWSPMWLWLATVLALVNAVDMTRESARLGVETRDLAKVLCTTWPQVDDSVLAGMYYGGAQVARERLQTLRDLGFAPFEPCDKGRKDGVPAT